MRKRQNLDKPDLSIGVVQLLMRLLPKLLKILNRLTKFKSTRTFWPPVALARCMAMLALKVKFDWDSQRWPTVGRIYWSTAWKKSRVYHSKREMCWPFFFFNYVFLCLCVCGGGVIFPQWPPIWRGVKLTTNVNFGLTTWGRGIPMFWKSLEHWWLSPSFLFRWTIWGFRSAVFIKVTGLAISSVWIQVYEMATGRWTSVSEN